MFGICSANNNYISLLIGSVITHVNWCGIFNVECTPVIDAITVMSPEFVDLYINHLLNDSIAKQFKAFFNGFHSICNSKALEVSLIKIEAIPICICGMICIHNLMCQLFHPEEIERLVCGCPEFDMKALEEVASYDGYKDSDTTIR